MSVATSDARHIIGSGLLARTLTALPGFTVRLDGMTTFTTATGERIDGDEVWLLASDPVQFESVETFLVNAIGLSSFTITGESSEPFVPPFLSMARSGTNLVFSWPDPNEIFELEHASPVDLPDEELAAFFFQPVTNSVSYLNNFRSLRLSIDPRRSEIFRLRHGQPRPPPQVD